MTTDHCEAYSRLPEDMRHEIDTIVDQVLSRIHDASDKFLARKLLLPSIISVTRWFSNKIDTAGFGEMEIGVLLTEIWERVRKELLERKS